MGYVWELDLPSPPQKQQMMIYLFNFNLFSMNLLKLERYLPSPWILEKMSINPFQYWEMSFFVFIESLKSDPLIYLEDLHLFGAVMLRGYCTECALYYKNPNTYLKSLHILSLSWLQGIPEEGQDLGLD